MTLIKLYKSEPTVCMSDLDLLENDIGHPLPEFFKDFYVEQNGGASDKDWWDSGDEYEPVRVKKFKSVAVSGADDAADTRFLGGCYNAMTSKDIIPQTLLPFAIDDGGNFFCLDLTDGNVCFYTTDSFDPESSFAANHAKAYRWLANSFDVFLKGLKDESDIDI
ncbi:SMI1/KNR4 family protein [Pseudomonas frederiksbergensis]|uniref:SMI1/KNR4 family protein n=1 Tax=Pseudomonas frederiksbergensis TaxID=104087 RepID=UPI003D192138